MKKKIRELEKRINKNEEIIEVLSFIIKIQMEQEEYNFRFNKLIRTALSGFGL